MKYLFWIWDTERDKKQAKQLEKRIKKDILKSINKKAKICQVCDVLKELKKEIEGK